MVIESRQVLHRHIRHWHRSHCNNLSYHSKRDLVSAYYEKSEIFEISQKSSTSDPTLGRRFCPENPYDSKLNTVRDKNSLSLTFAQEERLMKERLEYPAKELFRNLIDPDYF